MNFKQELLNILHSSSASRISLAEQLEVTRAYVTKLSNTLIEDGVIEETIQQSSGGGRPRTLLAVRRGQFYTLNIIVRELTIEASLNDFSTREDALAVIQHLIVHKINAEDFIIKIREIMSELCQSSAINIRQVKHIGIALQGGIEQHSGVVRWCPLFKDKLIPLKSLLVAALAMSVSVVNIAWCSSYLLEKNAKLQGSWIALMPGFGSLGFGYYIDGNPVFGDNGFYPEIVHLPFPGGIEKAFQASELSDDLEIERSIEALELAILCTAPVHNIKQVILTGEFFDSVPDDFFDKTARRLASHTNEHIHTIRLRYIKTEPNYSMKGLIRLSADAVSTLIC